MKYKLIYKGKEITYLLGEFDTYEEAESKKKLLAYNTQEYEINEMEIINDIGK